MSQETTVTPEDVLRIAKLARVHVDEHSIEHLVREMTGLLKWIAQLNQVETADVYPMANPLQDLISSTPMRRDSVTDGDQLDAILKNAPDKGLGMFVVPKVVE